MFDVKPFVLQALKTIEGVTVSDAYPSDFSKLPHISFYEVKNEEGVNALPGRLTDVAIAIDVWHNRSTGPIAKQVNEKMNAIGLGREFSYDVPDPSGVKHKTMRYRGLIDSKTLLVHQ